MKHKRITICFLAVLIASSALAAVHHVPEEYATIQAAINACGDFDTVVIAPGTYRGSGNRDINFNGKAITVRSTDLTDLQIVNSTIIDCEGKGRGFVFYTWEKADSTVAGLTITNGYALLGGAIYCCSNSSPSISNCVVKNNSAIFGGGIACASSKTKPKITNCNITANTALVGGGGFYLNASSPIIKNCIISANTAPTGGAIYSHNAGNPLIIGCTISGNVASDSAGAIYCYKSSNLTISHSILWDDTAATASEIMVGNTGAATSIHISYCDIQGGKENIIVENGCAVDWGQGNINLDPHFVNMGYQIENNTYITGDYHLLGGSPCIDAGDPGFVAGPDETDIDGNPRILGEIIDLGVDEVIVAEVKITPKALNLASSGNWISCTIQLRGYDIADVDTDSIALSKEIGPSEKIGPVWSSIDEEAQKLIVKFDRSKIQEMLKDVDGLVELGVSGTLTDGTEFRGAETIRIVRGGNKK